MLELHGFQAFVTCDGKELETYETVVDGRTISGWIAGEIGKPFTVTVRHVAAGYHPDTAQYLYVDGAMMTNKLADRDIYTHKGPRRSSTTFAPLIFAPLQTTDDPSLSALENSERGTIKMRIERRMKTKIVPRPPCMPYAMPDSVIYERDKMHALGGQSVTTGEVVRKTQKDYMYESRPYKHSDPIPYVTFVFNYRSREYLVAQGMIPVELPAPRDGKRQRKSTPRSEAEGARPGKRIRVDGPDADHERLQEPRDEMRTTKARLADLPASEPKRDASSFAIGETVDLTSSACAPEAPIKREPDAESWSRSHSHDDLTDD
ncbi:hypothetical protein AURDEDRAFT_183902 [Auricularia subglabra TFB-10046 SS5]|nr:hypothetical protein AURDEDRAFT_183902 [Auricularia subglabra TFB-10046 SS5]